MPYPLMGSNVKVGDFALLTLTLKADRAGDGWLKADNAGDAVGFSAGDAFGFAATPGLQKHAVRPHTAHTTAVAAPDSASNVIFEKPFIGRLYGFDFPMIRLLYRV